MAQQINKLIGYCTITLDNGEVIPMKFGWDATSKFCEHFGINPSEIYKTFFDFVEREVEVIEGGETKKVKETYPVCKNIGKFLPAVLWCGADFVNRFEGGPGYRLIDAANWIDDVGGGSSEQFGPVYAAFFKAIQNGGSPPRESTLPAEMQPKDKKKEAESGESH